MENKTAPTAQKILALVTQLSPGGVTPGPEHLKRIQAAVEKNLPIQFVLPAFPAKSSNHKKTSGPLPDFAEVLALQRLQHIAEQIQTIHAPGAKIFICSDGRVFSDLVLVSDQEVTAYAEGIRAIIAEFSLHALTTFDLDHANVEYDRLREQLLLKYARPLAEIRQRSQQDPAGRMLFNGIHRFLFEDRLPIETHKSRSRLREETKTAAYEVIRRSEAWGSLVAERFPEAVRLSIHPQPPGSSKLGVQLVPCQDHWGTPWHNVALLEGTNFLLVKREVAERQGAERKLAHEKYAFFAVKEPNETA